MQPENVREQYNQLLMDEVEREKRKVGCADTLERVFCYINSRTWRKIAERAEDEIAKRLEELWERFDQPVNEWELMRVEQA